MLYLLTGQPGSGKTALAIDRALTLASAEGRSIYAHGIKDLDFEKAGFKRFPDDDPARWQELPDGSVCLIDECYSTFPNRNPGSKVPEHVEALARHRHRGFDFIMVAQQGLQLDPFIRGLYESHEHVQAKFGKWCTVKRWAQYQGNVTGHCSDKATVARPQRSFAFYTSTVKDTKKHHVPKWVIWIGVLLAFLFSVTWYLKASTAAKIEEMNAKHELARERVTAGPSVAGGRTSAESVTVYTTAEEYVVAATERVPGLPWTAPLFDGRAAVSQPVAYCIESGAGLDALGEWREASCSCKTEQGTTYATDPKQCRIIARNGGPYNPFKQPVAAVGAAPPAQGGGIAPAANALPGSVIEAEQVSGYGGFGLDTPSSAPR